MLNPETISILRIADKILYVVLVIAAALIAGKISYIRKQKEKEKWRKEWEREHQEKQDPHQMSKPLTQQSFEEWKAEKRKRDQGGFIDLDAEISLPWRRAT